ncbi:hypothetical protein H6G89_09190 [Oscillatoria sp. FACHB-1407]|nr:hypothetical protein [Oscillatoria sp. FACHB-1407]MBD2461218.1 hypothetical protein [Oscillatoria sp. FACHB-1407]
MALHFRYKICTDERRLSQVDVLVQTYHSTEVAIIPEQDEGLVRLRDDDA